MLGWGKALEVGLGIIDKVIPDKEEAAKMKLEVMRLDQQGEFKELDRRMDAIIMEAQSQDPWTSRARPSFMYVMYVLLLWSLPLGFFYVAWPEQTQLYVEGVKYWLTAIPEPLYILFGAGYLGYTNARSKDKQVAIGQEPKRGLLSAVLG
jgi:hypothetical protein